MIGIETSRTFLDQLSRERCCLMPGDWATALAARVGRTVIADVEAGARTYPDLGELIDACREPSDEECEPTEREYQVGLSALAAQRVCAEPAALDRLAEEERAEEVLGFARFLVYLGNRRAPHLAPGPPAAFPEVLRRCGDGETLALALWGVTTVMLESTGPEGYQPLAEEIERYLATLPEPLAAAFEAAERKITRNPAIGVGRALRTEAETGARRFGSLTELVRASVDLDLPAGDDEEDESDYALGTAAMTAASLCAEPEILDRLPEESHAMPRAAFVVMLRFVQDNSLWQLAPEPLGHYPALTALYDDPVEKAEVSLRAASIIRERGDVARSLDILLALDDEPLPPGLAATRDLHAANTFRDVRRFDDAARRYELAEEAAGTTGEPDRAKMLAEIAHQRHRLSMYSKDHPPRPGDEKKFDPNPFRPGFVLEDPERGRADPAQLLTLEQEARRAGDVWTAHRILLELAAVVPPSHYEFQTWLHSEAAELAERFGRFPDTVRWHGLLATCAAILSGTRRELGNVLSRQAARLASFTESLPAYAFARWAAAADRVALYSAVIKADIGFVLYRNGSLSIAKSTFDASLAEEDSRAVRVQRDLVAALLGEPVEPVEDDVGDRALDEVHLTRWRAAARLLTSTADDLHTWEDLLRFSKGEIIQWSEPLHHVVQGHRQRLDDELPALFGNAAIDNAKARAFEAIYTTGLLGMLDGLWKVPRWASAAWVLAGGSPAGMRERIGREVVVSWPPPSISSTFAPGPLPDVSQAAARLDRLLALTFLPAGNTDFGDTEDAAELRAWAARFLADHAGRITFRLTEDERAERNHAEFARHTHRIERRIAKLPPRLQSALWLIAQRRQLMVALGPVRDIGAVEREFVAGLAPRDARELKEVLDARMRITTDVLPSAAERDRVEVRGWFTGRRQATVDLVQGTDQAHLIVCRRDATDITDLTIGRPQAEAAVARARLASESSDVVKLTSALRAAAGRAGEISLRLREPWESIPVENITDPSGRSLSDTVVVVRRHGRRPRFGTATAKLPRQRVEVLGDPRGDAEELGLPGSFEEARAIGTIFGADASVRDAATWDRLKECAARAELLWISTHCRPFAELGGTPALLLHDRWVLPAEIAALGLRPGAIVVLTVCGGGRGVSLGAVSGPPLAAAFLDAGAALVVAPLRPIRDAEWAPHIIEAARHARARRGSAVDLVRMLNAPAPAREQDCPWVMHG